MKLYVAAVLLGVTCFATGCGPGLTHRVAAAPVATTRLTSAEVLMPLDKSDPWTSIELDKSDPWTEAAPAPVAQEAPSTNQ